MTKSPTSWALRAVALVAVAAVAAQSAFAIEVTSIRRTVSASFLGVDPFGDDPPFDSARESTRADGFFEPELSLGAGGATAIATQDSEVVVGASVVDFAANGQASAQLTVQGDAESDAQSRFVLDFSLDDGGTLVIDEGSTLGAVDFFVFDVARDRPGFARVVLRVFNRDTGEEVVREVVRIDGATGAGPSEFEFEGPGIVLPGGNFRLVINATASDDSAGEGEVEGSIATAFYEIEGLVTEDILP